MGELLIKNLLLLSGFIIFCGYVIYIWWRYGVQKSISITFYELPRVYKGVFRGYIWLLSLVICLIGFYWETPLFYVSGALLSLVGIFSRVKSTGSNVYKFYMHVIGAVGGILSGYIGIFLLNWRVGLFASVVSILGFILSNSYSKKTQIWYDEIICFIMIIGSLFYITNFI